MVEEQAYLGKCEQPAENVSTDLLSTSPVSSRQEKERHPLAPDQEKAEQGHAEKQLLLADCQDDLEDGLKKQKSDELQKINADMQCLRGIYTDLANHVESQKENIDSIESQMKDAAIHTSQATEQLEVAKYY